MKTVSTPIRQKAAAEPLYLRIKEALEEEMRTGRLNVGDQLPTEKELCERHGVSRITIRKTLDLMEEEGSIRRLQGKGSFVLRLPQREEPPSPQPAPHIRRRVELRCCVPSHMEDNWESESFRTAFAKAFPGVFLTLSNAHEYSSTPWSIYHDSDLYAVAPEHYREVERRGLLGDWRANLGTPYFDEIQADLADPLHAAIGETRLRHLLPVFYTPLHCVYNKRIFDAANLPYPRFYWQEEEFIETARALKGHPALGGGFPFLCEMSNTYRWPFAVYREGGRLWSEDGRRCLLESEEALRGIGFLRKIIIDLKIARSYVVGDTSVDHTLFLRDRVAMQLMTLGSISRLVRHGHRDWGIASIPEGVQRRGPFNAISLALAPAQRNPSLTAEFIRFIRTHELLGRDPAQYYVLSASRRVMKERLARSTPEMRTHYEAFLNVGHEMAPQEFPAHAEAATRLHELMPLVWMDLERADQHCRGICAEINALTTSPETPASS